MAEQKKPTIAIFDFTDCEGCELQVIALREKIIDLINKVEIVNWRLAMEETASDFDIALIEGTPLTPDEILQLTKIRKTAKILVALGACAHLGGINSGQDPARPRLSKNIYSTDYQLKVDRAFPLSHYVKIDAVIPGCPVDQDYLERCLSELIIGRIPKLPAYAVCAECRAAQVSCLLQEGRPCLGPITIGGCGAICTKNGKECTGCFGLLEGQNEEALIRIIGKENLDEQKNIFLANENRANR